MSPLSTPVTDNISNVIVSCMWQGCFGFFQSRCVGKIFLEITSLVCESSVPEPIDGVCKILCGSNVQTLVSCRPGVESDTQPAII